MCRNEYIFRYFWEFRLCAFGRLGRLRLLGGWGGLEAFWDAALFLVEGMRGGICIKIL